ncbi:hypothetical protein QR680_006310 [Steinernema hermaphroditum]|uniref:Fe2OG dioxygenase domain-containing protein n=1 Tax=Steinernema hermaphroditum TaxID=289476 RepID=A0AA39HXC6_9BILA|nr:hypothetical protein QR680_006310 [Steinernema hermaphroditum]
MVIGTAALWMFSLIFCVRSHGDHEYEGWQYPLSDCDQRRSPNSVYNDYRCYNSHMNLIPLRVEVLSKNPALLVFHEFFSKSRIANFLSMASEKEMEETSVEGAEGTVKSRTRVAHGTWIDHHENIVASDMFHHIQSKFNTIDFDRAEAFHVLRYGPGGHYAPHYDMLQHDTAVELVGNRIVTFLTVLKTAQKGGGTVFPRLGITVQPNPGDVMFWFNMEPDASKAMDSLHGACPILEGEKIGATLWVKAFGQEFLTRCPMKEGAPFDYNPLVEPRKSVYDEALLSGLHLF